MSLSHGNAAAHKSIHAPLSRSFSGPFGRLFRNLEPWEPPGRDEAAKLRAIAKIAAEMDERKAPQNESRDNHEIPAGYTYFGQFVDHDITFDPRSSLQKHIDPESLLNFRSPALDLDCVYGRGPEEQPYLYESDGRFRIDTIGTGEEDLPRHGQTALIGDKRNDENTIVSQVQLTFLKFHNALLLQTGGDFREAQRLARWHYQWVVVHDWLKRLCGKQLVDQLLAGACPGEVNLCFYKYRHQPFMPVEFSGAAYRLGHSMIRGGYSLNAQVSAPTFRPEDTVAPTDDFRGFKCLPDHWTIEWHRFFDFPGHDDPQPSLKLDRFLVSAMIEMPKPIADRDDVPGPAPQRTSLAMRNLVRGWRLQLPSGQAVAARMGVETRVPGSPELPLWRYILDEAQLEHDGIRLGEVGARIVAETFIGLLHGDPASYLRIAPKWQPELPKIGPRFEMRDIIQFAGQRI